MSVAEKSELADMVPEEWQNKYDDVILTKGKDGHDYLYGVSDKGNVRLGWGQLGQAVEATYGFEWTGPYPALRAENAELRQQNIVLKQELADLHVAMAEMEERLNLKIKDLEAKIDADPLVFDPGRFQEVRVWKPQPGDKIPSQSHDGPGNVLTVESINPADKSATVVNSEGRRFGLPLAQLSKHWNTEQNRLRDDRLAALTDGSFQGRLQRARDRILRRHTETTPTVVVNEDGESVVLLEDREVQDTRPAAAAVVAAGLLLAGVIGYEIGQGEHPAPKTIPIPHIVPRPLPKNEITIGKNRYKVLLNEEKALAAAQSANAELRRANQALRQEEKHESGSPTSASLSYAGDTVWSEVSRRVSEKLGYQATTDKIRRATAYVLQINGLRWNGGGYGVDAHRLPVGFRFKIPDNLVSIINK